MDTSFVEFRQLQEVGVFSYLVISYLKAMTMVLGVVRPGRATDFGYKKWIRCMMREGGGGGGGLSMDSSRTCVDC